jgi:hypothetical protein
VQTLHWNKLFEQLVHLFEMDEQKDSEVNNSVTDTNEHQTPQLTQKPPFIEGQQMDWLECMTDLGAEDVFRFALHCHLFLQLMQQDPSPYSEIFIPLLKKFLFDLETRKTFVCFSTCHDWVCFHDKWIGILI